MEGTDRMEAFWVYIILKMLYVAGCTIGLSGTREARPSSLVRIKGRGVLHQQGWSVKRQAYGKCPEGLAPSL